MNKDGNRVVIAGSASLQKEIKKWLNLFEQKNYLVINYPQPISPDNFIEDYPQVHQEFFQNITEADFLFIMNENKKGIEGYIGAETFAELCFGIAQNLLHKQNLQIIIYQMPSPQVQSHEEIDLWLKLGWINLYENSPLKFD